MKIFTNKNLIQKLIIAIVAVTLLNFCIAPMQVKAATVGGTLMKPIRDLFVTIGDAFASIVQYGLTGKLRSAIKKDSSAILSDNSGKFWISKVRYPIIQISPELIFANDVELLDANFVTMGNTNREYEIKAESKTNLGSETNALTELRKIIASWYVTLRTLSVVGLLSVLIYVGIRIIISSTGQDKAKYKQRLMDWVVAFCLLFFMHYIMVGIVTIVDELNKALKNGITNDYLIDLDPAYGTVEYNDQADEQRFDSMDETDYGSYDGSSQAPDPIPLTQDDVNAITNILNSNGIYATYENEGKTHTWDMTNNAGKNLNNLIIKFKLGNDTEDYSGNYVYSYGGLSDDIRAQINSIVQNRNVNGDSSTSGSGSDTSSGTGTGTQGQTTEGGTTSYDGIKVSTDPKKIRYFINYARLYCNANSDNNAEGFGFTILYIILVSFTVMFTFRYAKRVIYIAFLTMIAPLVAFTYPLDKIKDGRAQAFNMWVREYIFNLLIQPFHFLIYSILVGSATSLAHQHMIYAVVAIAFLIPAEKLLRKFFGFDNAGTLSAAGSFAGGAIFSQVISKLNKSQSGKGGSGGEGNRQTRLERPRNTKGQVNADEEFVDINGGSRSQGIQTGRTNTSTDYDRAREFKRLRQMGLSQEEALGILNKRENTNNANDENNVNDANRTTNESTDYDTENGPHDWLQRLANRQENDYDNQDWLGKMAIDTEFDLQDKGRIDRNWQKEQNKEQRRENIRAKASKIALRGADMADALWDRKKRQLASTAKSLPGKMSRAAIGTIGGATLALTGAAIGAASGDPNSVMKLAVAGAGAGYMGANHYAGNVANEIRGDIKAMEPAYWGADWKAHQQEVYDREVRNSEPYIQAYANVSGGSRTQGKQLMDENEEFIKMLHEQNITDTKMESRAVKMYDDYVKGKRKYGTQTLTKEQAARHVIAVAKDASNVSAGVWETGSHAHRVFVNERTRQLQNRQIKDNKLIEDAINTRLTEMSDLKFGFSK